MPARGRPLQFPHQAPAASALDPFAMMQPWLEFQRMWWQTAWGTPQVIMMRLADLGTHPALWTSRQRREASRMFSEKAAAFHAGLIAAGEVLAQATPGDHLLSLKMATAGLQPSQSRVDANLARLAGKARTVTP